MLRTTLLALALTFPSSATLGASGVVDDILAVTADDTEQRMLLGWGYFESLWGTHNLGDCTCKDAKTGKATKCPNMADRHVGNCTSFGVMQVKKPEMLLSGATPAKVATDRRLGFRVGLAAFRWCMKATGGDIRASLRLYSSGRADRAFLKVERRCAMVGC